MAKSKYQKRLQDNKSKIIELLEDEHLILEMNSFVVREEDKTKIEAKVSSNLGEEYYLSGTGRGSVDALWKAMGPIKDDYGILDEIKFEGYRARAVSMDEDIISTDSMVEVEIVLKNSETGRMVIQNESRSVLKASVECFIELVEYLINSQKAFKKLQVLIEDSDKRNRQDLKTKYVNMLSELTRIISHKNIKGQADS